MRLISTFVLCVFLTSQTGYSQGSNPGLGISEDLRVGGRGSEYMSGASPGSVQMKINLWGSVQKPGIHHVPVKTSLVTLLSYAGGPTEKANIDDILIRRTKDGKETTMEVDLDDVLESSAKNPLLEPNDIIIIPQSRELVSHQALQTVMFVGGILGIILSSIAINNSMKD